MPSMGNYAISLSWPFISDVKVLHRFNFVNHRKTSIVLWPVRREEMVMVQESALESFGANSGASQTLQGGEVQVQGGNPHLARLSDITRHHITHEASHAQRAMTILTQCK